MSFRKKFALFAVIAAALICAFGAWIFNIVNSNAFYSEVASLSCSRMPLDLKIYKICLAFLDYDCAKEEGMHNIPSGGMPKFLDTLDAHLKKEGITSKKYVLLSLSLRYVKKNLKNPPAWQTLDSVKELCRTCTYNNGYIVEVILYNYIEHEKFYMIYRASNFEYMGSCKVAYKAELDEYKSILDANSDILQSFRKAFLAAQNYFKKFGFAHRWFLGEDTFSICFNTPMISADKSLVEYIDNSNEKVYSIDKGESILLYWSWSNSWLNLEDQYIGGFLALSYNLKSGYITEVCREW